MLGKLDRLWRIKILPVSSTLDASLSNVYKASGTGLHHGEDIALFSVLSLTRHNIHGLTTPAIYLLRKDVHTINCHMKPP